MDERACRLIDAVSDLWGRVPERVRDVAGKVLFALLIVCCGFFEGWAG